MEINAYYTRMLKTEDGDAEITFTVKGMYSINQLSELVKGTLYRARLTEVKSKRSIKQNSLLWELIHEISIKRNGEQATSDDDWDVYLEALEKANAKFEYIAIKPDAVPLLKEHFRAVKELNRFTTEKGVEMVQCRVYYGSSKMDIKEMGKLLDTVLDIASEYEIYIKEIEL